MNFKKNKKSDFYFFKSWFIPTLYTPEGKWLVLNRKSTYKNKQQFWWRTWQQMDICERNVENGDEKFVCQRINKTAESGCLVGKVPSYQTIELTTFTRKYHSAITAVSSNNNHVQGWGVTKYKYFVRYNTSLLFWVLCNVTKYFFTKVLFTCTSLLCPSTFLLCNEVLRQKSRFRTKYFHFLGV